MRAVFVGVKLGLGSLLFEAVLIRIQHYIFRFRIVGFLVWPFVLSFGAFVGVPDDVSALPGLPTAEPVTFRAADDVVVHGMFYGAASAKADSPIVVMFHQAGSNSAEYAPIAPRVAEKGFHCLAIDQRSGGYKWSEHNRTVRDLGRSTMFLKAYPDLEAAIGWVRKRGLKGPLLVWGSSYSASLVFKLAALNPNVHGVLAFSPGEHLGPGEPVRSWAARVHVPVYVTSASGDEVLQAKRIFDAVPSSDKIQFDPPTGIHGSSTLRSDRNPTGIEENWQAVGEFLERWGWETHATPSLSNVSPQRDGIGSATGSGG